jgi:hypothetical protein
MQTKERKVYPYITLDHQGNFHSLGVQTYATVDQVSDNFIYIGLQPVDLTFEVPDDEQLLAGALKVVGVQQDKCRAELQGKLIFLEQVKNSLLRLTAPEVLDRVDSPHARNLQDVEEVIPRQSGADPMDDDIPF